MFDLKNRTYVVLEFATADDITNHKIGRLKFCTDNIVEVAAVKIENGEIKKHFSTFVAVEGCDPQLDEFQDGNFSSLGVTEPHLIGAPDFKEVAERVYDFAKASVIIVRDNFSWRSDPYTLFKEKAASYGFIFNNPVLIMERIYAAMNLRKAVENSGIEFEKISLLQLAAMMGYESKSWKETFEEYDIFTFTEYVAHFVRYDSLTWALGFAQLFINLVEEETEKLENVDEKSPF